MKKYTVINMSGAYKRLAGFISELNKREDVVWIDCESLSGTECYCDSDSADRIRGILSCNGIDYHGVHFIDNGNYHYLSKLLTDSIDEPFNLFVADNHPDTQSPLFGPILSCGSWVKDLIEENKNVNNVYLSGVNPQLITHEVTGMDKVVVLDSGADIMDVIPDDIPVYISIDKDVLDIDECVTNWDQGNMSFNALTEIIKNLISYRQVLGVDICGEMDSMMYDKADNIRIHKNDTINIELLNALDSF